jgi:hypothetical protein
MENFLTNRKHLNTVNMGVGETETQDVRLT